MQQIQQNVEAAFRGNQLICIALLAGQFLFGVVIFIVHSGGGFAETGAAPEVVELFAPIGIGAGLLAIPAAYALRKLIWGRGSAGDATAVIQSFIAGNLVFHAVIEGASLLNLTFWLITVQAVPYLVIAALLFAIGLTGIPRRAQATGNDRSGAGRGDSHDLTGS